MATNQQNQDTFVKNEYSKTKERLQSINKEVKGVHTEMQDIDLRLQSWGLATMEAIGLAVDDVTDDSHLHILPNDKLSRNDLLRKKNLMQDRLEQLNAELRSQYAIIRQLKFDAKLEQNRQHAELLRKEQAQEIKLYQADPEAFFAENAFEYQVDWALPKEKFFASADKLIAVCEMFNPETDLEQIWRGWKIVAKARNLAMDDYNNFIMGERQATDNALHHDSFKRNEKYAAGAKKYFNAFTNLLPPGMQGLKLLYEARDFDRAEYYLSEAFAEHIIDDEQEYTQLLSDLAAEVHETCMRNSLNVLTKLPAYAKLSKDLREELVHEHAFSSQFRFDLSYLVGNLPVSDLEPFNQYAKLLEEHITNILTTETSKTVAEAEFAKIKLQIAQHADIIRKKLVWGEHEPLPDTLQMGAGLGLGWLYGIQQITASARTIKLPELDDDLGLAGSLEANDYNFINEEDEFWESNVLPKPEARSWMSNLRRNLKEIVKAVTGIFVKPERLVPAGTRGAFIIPEKSLLAMESMAPGFGQRLAGHFKRRANDIFMAIEQAEKSDNTDASEIIRKDLQQLESDWQSILNSADDPEDFCAVVDLYLTSRYSIERNQYIEVSQDLRKEPYIDQERKVLLFEYQHEREEIQELHDLKQLLQQVIRPNA